MSARLAVQMSTLGRRLLTTQPTGAYEQNVLDRAPVRYYKTGESSGSSLADSSGNAQNATINGTVAGYRVAGPDLEVGSSSSAIDLGATADIQIAHHADFEATYAVSRTIVASQDAQLRSEPAISLWFRFPSLVNNAVIAAKQESETAWGTTAWGWTVRVMADGRVIIRDRTHFRPVEYIAPAGSVTANTWYHLVVCWGRRGLWATLNGKHFADGYPAFQHWYGWKHRIRDDGVGTGAFPGGTFTNTAPIRIGKSGSSSRTNMQVAQIAVFMATSDATRLSLSDAQVLAASGSVAPLKHHVFGRSEVPLTPGSGLQAAVTARSDAGGGRVILSAGTYTGNVAIPDNVEIVGVGDATVLTGAISCGTLGTGTAITNPATNLAAGATSWTLSSGHGVQAGDWLRLVSNRVHQARWGSSVITGSGTSDPTLLEVEHVRVASVDGLNVTFSQPVYYSFPSSERTEVRRITPAKNIGLRNLRIQRSGQCFTPSNVDGLRIIDVTFVQTATSATRTILMGNCMAVDSPQGMVCDGRSETTPNSAFSVAYACRDVTIRAGDFLEKSGHCITHITSDAMESGTIFPEYVDCTFRVGSTAAGGGLNNVDVHGVAAEVRIIGGQIVGGSAGVGGFAAGGYRLSVEDVGQSGGIARFSMHDGGFEMYWRNIMFSSPTQWFDTTDESITTRGVGSSHFQDLQYSGSAAAVDVITDADFPNTYINVEAPLPTN